MPKVMKVEFGLKSTVLKTQVVAKMDYQMDQSGRCVVKGGRLQGFRVDDCFNPFWSPFWPHLHPICSLKFKLQLAWCLWIPKSWLLTKFYSIWIIFPFWPHLNSIWTPIWPRTAPFERSKWSLIWKTNVPTSLYFQKLPTIPVLFKLDNFSSLTPADPHLTPICPILGVINDPQSKT